MTTNQFKVLDSFGAIRPTVKNDLHVRIPQSFLDWLASVLVGNDSKKNLKNDILVVFTLLRSQGPTWRWNKDRVWKELARCNLKIGRGRVEQALRFLKQHGWTRAVIVKKADELVATEFLEVQWRQLPPDEWRTKRVVRLDSNGGIRVFEDDGREVHESNYSPLKLISTEKQVELDQIHSSRKKTRKANGPAEAPLCRKPEHRTPGEEYTKPLSIKDPQSPSGEGPIFLAPLEEEHSPGPPGPGLEEETEVFSRVEGEEVTGEEECGAVLTDPPIDWIELRNLAIASRDSEDAQREYEEALLRMVFPRLEDPPVRDRRTRTECLEWCRESVKGQLILQLAEESVWTPEFARTFVTSPGKWSLEDCRSIFRSAMIGGRSRTMQRYGSLAELVRGKRDAEKKTPWEHVVEVAREIDFGQKKVVSQNLRDFSSSNMTHDRALREAARMRDFALDDDVSVGVAEDLDGRNLLLKLLSRHFTNAKGGLSETNLMRSDSRSNLWSERMTRLAAADHVALLLMRSFLGRAEDIWGVQWREAEAIHPEIAEHLNLRAELFELEDRVLPDPFWFHQEIVLPES